MKDLLSVKFFTVDRQIPVIECDGIRLPIADKLNIFSAHISDGFAIVENNEINITVDKVTE